jgi:hypothetical protein
MDGRVQLPVIEYLRRRLGLPYVDSITEPGPILSMSEDPTGEVARSILRRVTRSIEKHGSHVVAVVAHYDCGGNPAVESAQREQLAKSVDLLAEQFPSVTIIGLWVNEQWRVSEVTNRPPL